MKNRNCPEKYFCWDYNASNCDGCVSGEKFKQQARKIKRLKEEIKELEEELKALALVAASLANELNMTDEEFDEEVKAARKKVKGEKK